MVLPSPVPFQPQVPGFKAYDLDSYLNLTFSNAGNIIDDDVLPIQGRLVVLALKGVGKTIITQQLALELASGGPALGLWRVLKPCRVLVIQKELQDGKYQERLQQSSMQYPHLRSDYIQVVPQAESINIRVDDQQAYQRLEQAIIFYQPEVIVLDPWEEFFHFNENNSWEMKPALESLDRLRLKYGVSFIISHHTVKPQSDPRTGNRFAQDMYAGRGSGRFIEWADTTFTLNGDKTPGKVLMTTFMRHGHQDPPVISMTLNRRYATFDAEVQGIPTTDAEWKITSTISRNHDEMLYNDLIDSLAKQKVGPVVARMAVNSMLRKHILYYMGNVSVGANRIVRMLSPQTRTWMQ